MHSPRRNAMPAKDFFLVIITIQKVKRSLIVISEANYKRQCSGSSSRSISTVLKETKTAKSPALQSLACMHDVLKVAE
eukprot:scaffold278832_cov22-Prasinocladus_malaysianus.AAC.1